MIQRRVKGSLVLSASPIYGHNPSLPWFRPDSRAAFAVLYCHGLCTQLAAKSSCVQFASVFVLFYCYFLVKPHNRNRTGESLELFCVVNLTLQVSGSTKHSLHLKKLHQTPMMMISY